MLCNQRLLTKIKAFIQRDGSLDRLWTLFLSSIRADGIIRRDEKFERKSPFDADTLYGDHWYT